MKHSPGSTFSFVLEEPQMSKQKVIVQVGGESKKIYISRLTVSCLLFEYSYEGRARDGTSRRVEVLEAQSTHRKGAENTLAELIIFFLGEGIGYNGPYERGGNRQTDESFQGRLRGYYLGST